MRTSVKWGAIAACVAVTLGAGMVSGIAQDKLAMIKDRQDFMKAQGADVKAIADYSKGTGDQAAATKAVDDLLARAPKIVDHFPAGTSIDDFPGKTAAKPDIWKDWDKVKMIPTVLMGEEEKLKTAIQSGDQKAVGDQLGATNKNGCGSCHGPYRVKTS